MIDAPFILEKMVKIKHKWFEHINIRVMDYYGKTDRLLW